MFGFTQKSTKKAYWVTRQLYCLFVDEQTGQVLAKIIKTTDPSELREGDVIWNHGYRHYITREAVRDAVQKEFSEYLVVEHTASSTF